MTISPSGRRTTIPTTRPRGLRGSWPSTASPARRASSATCSRSAAACTSRARSASSSSASAVRGPSRWASGAARRRRAQSWGFTRTIPGTASSICGTKNRQIYRSCSRYEENVVSFYDNGALGAYVKRPTKNSMKTRSQGRRKSLSMKF